MPRSTCKKVNSSAKWGDTKFKSTTGLGSTGVISAVVNPLEFGTEGSEWNAMNVIVMIDLEESQIW